MSKPRFDQAYLGHETWWNRMRMAINMNLRVLSWSYFLTGLGLFLLLLHNEPALTMSWNYLRHTVDAVWQVLWGNVSLHQFTSYVHQCTMELLQLTWPYILALVFVPFVVQPIWILFFRRIAKHQDAPEHLRGPTILTTKAVREAMRQKKFDVRFTMNKLPFPKQIEKYHTECLGTTGMGKTANFFAPYIAACLEQGEMGIIHCTKGDFTSRFYRYESAPNAEQNQLFNPLDSRSLKWTLFNDIEDIPDLDRIARVIIPENKNDRDPLWIIGAQDILIGLLFFAHAHGFTRNRELYEIFTSTPKQKLEFLKHTPYGAEGRSYLANPESKTATSFNATFNSRLRPFKYLDDGPFSIRKWFDQSREHPKGFIFLMNNPKYQDSIRPCLTLFMDIFTNQILSQREDIATLAQRRYLIFLDEFGSLDRLPSMYTLLKEGRGYGAAITIGLQDHGQLERSYGPAEARTILGSLNNCIYMKTTDPKTVKEVSEKIGDQEIVLSEYSSVTGIQDYKDGITINRRRNNKRLVMESEIQYLPQRHAVVRFTNLDDTLNGVIRADISSSRLYLEETRETDPRVRTVSKFVAKPGLDLENIRREQHMQTIHTEIFSTLFATDGSRVNLATTSSPPAGSTADTMERSSGTRGPGPFTSAQHTSHTTDTSPRESTYPDEHAGDQDDELPGAESTI